jgi:hypothetical protein
MIAAAGADITDGLSSPLTSPGSTAKLIASLATTRPSR